MLVLHLFAAAFVLGWGVGLFVMRVLAVWGVGDEIAGNLAVMAWWLASILIFAFGQLLPGFDQDIKRPSSRPRAEGKLETAELRMAFVFGMVTCMGIMNIPLDRWIQALLVTGMAAVGGCIGHIYKCCVYSLREQTPGATGGRFGPPVSSIRAHEYHHGKKSFGSP